MVTLSRIGGLPRRLAGDRTLARDAVLALLLAMAAASAAALWPGVRSLDVPGAVLIAAAHAPLAVIRRLPAPGLAALVVLVLPYHLLQYQHHALVPAEVVALFAYAVLGRRARVVLAVVATLLLTCVVGMAMRAGGSGVREQIAVIEAVVAVAIAVQVWRSHRARLAEITERAEHAERTREQEARRRVAEERLRIARDLHDLLAHSITVIGVQAGAAAHLVRGDRPLDRTELADALASIAATCRDARTELRGTLQVLRGTDVAEPGALPGLDGVGELVSAARGGGIRVTFRDESAGPDGRRPPPEVAVAAYRIVQEALTNVVKHAGAASAEVSLTRAGGDLVVRVADDGRGAAAGPPGGPAGFGVLGMIERARSIGGTLDAGPAAGGGFTVTAILPVGRAVAPR
ncbi:sensor histidine kinase [Actinomadura algeriensis]|uniref:histidine kinase n=1 Tax=Actinomadura algeriensis TaxID=1679523 RepID=A0ABR9JZR5_9ACTN|nr:histidine kinase [Actinomadura algeriensis]MBE1536065.1 signal transduction histidine kinase [Actinomadura algeriensis]